MKQKIMVLSLVESLLLIIGLIATFFTDYFGKPGGAAGAGSSFVSGMTGCIAINPTSSTEPRAQDSTANKKTLNYNESIFGNSVT